MLDKETYKKELIRMWDSIRVTYKGSEFCSGIPCGECPLDQTGGCDYPINAIAMAEAVEKWSNEHPPKKYKVSQVEYDILKSFEESNLYSKFYFMSSLVTRNLLKLGYFEGADERMKICDYLNDCEVTEDVK